MARRTKNDDGIELVVKLAGLAMLLCLISPQVRQALSVIVIIALCLLGLFIIGFIGFRVITRPQRAEIVEWKTFNSRVTTDEKKPPQTPTSLIDQLHSIDWFQFEQLTALVYRKLGYTVTRRGGANPDGGIDLAIERDGECIGVQCKHWRTWNVGVKTV